ncbi:MAG: response regulator [bacterium]|nr:response regulator [bacterium]
MATILLVEDDEFIRSLLGDKFRSLGYKVQEAKDGKEGVEKAKKEKPDAIVMDLMMPVMDGFEALKQIKEDKDLSSLPVVILSNVDQKTDLDRAMALGAADYLIKIYNTPEEIVEKVRKAISL